MRSHRVEQADGPTLHVAETGPRDARPLVLLHGYSQHHRVWRPQLTSGLADDFRLVAVDLRGHGDSETPPDGYDDGEAWADDLAAVLEALDLRDAVLVGWSYGSLVTFDYLAAHGTDRVAGLVLVGVVPGLGTATTNEWLQAPYVDLFPDLVSTDAATSVAALERFVDVCVHERLPLDERHRALGFTALVPPFVRDGMRDRRVSHLDLLETLSVPALLVHGAHDDVIAPAAAEAAAARLPDATVTTYPESGHTPFVEAADRFNSDLRGFATGLD